MTTKEYIQLVDRVVGTKGSLKVPAYWMNRLMKESTKMIEDEVKNIDLSNYPTWDQADGHYAFRYEVENLLQSFNNFHDSIMNDARQYAQSLEISGPKVVSINTVYSIDGLMDRPGYTVTWRGNDSCTISETGSVNSVAITSEATSIGYLTLYADIYYFGEYLTNISRNLYLSIKGVDCVITRNSNSNLQNALYNAGLVANSQYSTRTEIASITAQQLQPGTSASSSIFSGISYLDLSDLEYFTGLKYIFSNTFSGIDMARINIPRSVELIQSGSFKNQKYEYNEYTIYIPKSVKTIESGAFALVGSSWNCDIYLENINTLFIDCPEQFTGNDPHNLYLVDKEDGVMKNKRIIKKIDVPENASINNMLYHSSITDVNFLGSNVVNNLAFARSTLERVSFSNTNCESADSAFYQCPLKEISGTVSSIHPDTFSEISDDVILLGNVNFGIIKLNPSNITIDGNKVSNKVALLFGDHVVKANDNYFFEDGSSEKTITVGFKPTVVDLTEELKVSMAI